MASTCQRVHTCLKVCPVHDLKTRCQPAPRRAPTGNRWHTLIRGIKAELISKRTNGKAGCRGVTGEGARSWGSSSKILPRKPVGSEVTSPQMERAARAEATSGRRSWGINTLTPPSLCLAPCWSPHLSKPPRTPSCGLLNEQNYTSLFFKAPSLESL